MRTKLFTNMYDFECRLFRSVNRHYDQKLLNFYFRHITHLGGAIATISISLLLIFFTRGLVQFISIASAASLLISHLPVALVKKLYPRKRPYIALMETKVTDNPLQDHSFPSGHTTAIFSVIIPFILFIPELSLVLLPLAFSVAVSRMYLGLHYPSDVLVGCLLGCTSGIFSSFMLENYMLQAII
ncbi:phosphatase PAP2 family protein [Metabacillus malikii]|uniref:Undecaprenyl-diphosphatase n=1 Tax=Metabacillus malikii TaxID=1504265 RepID=A0ABT9ZFV1_9BACI|nr:phosphatase PAP2 family protein [Metabacillus malikii]MDQ0231152.1 undecaprenyl-diphosphatase [Metabacillus malikii]